MRTTRAVFFDWFNTLARYEPTREEMHSRALRDFGIEVSPEKLLPGLMAADVYIFGENAISPVEKRDQTAKAKVYVQYMRIVLDGAGIKLGSDVLLAVMKKMQQLSAGMAFVLFDDVLPTLKSLKERKLILGLITNATRSMISVYHKLGLEPCLDFVVTSEEAGADKPKPPIFLAALDRAGVDASKAIHVGDQYQLDIMGAKGVGISPVLIDRYNLYSDVKDCPRIQNLPELLKLIN